MYAIRSYYAIKEANKIAGRNGVGRVDIIEDRVLGLKSRENYECPSYNFV